jgi:hypothetical protein
VDESHGRPRRPVHRDRHGPAQCRPLAGHREVRMACTRLPAIIWG